jgi:hypothetical protein
MSKNTIIGEPHILCARMIRGHCGLRTFPLSDSGLPVQTLVT